MKPFPSRRLSAALLLFFCHTLLTLGVSHGALLFFINDEAGFNSQVNAMFLTFDGSEDFESSSLAPASSAALDDPLAPGAPNGPFVAGTNPAAGVIVQSNTLGANAPTPSPQGADGLETHSAGVVLGGGATASDGIWTFFTGSSLDLIIAPPDETPVRAVSFRPLSDNPGTNMEIEIRNASNAVLGGSSNAPAAPDASQFVGVVATAGENLHRLNLFDFGATRNGADDIFVYTTPTSTVLTGGGNWSNSATWANGVVPTVENDILVPASAGPSTIDAAFEGHDGTISSLELDLTSGGSLTLSRNLTVTGAAVFSGDGSVFAGNDVSVVDGAVLDVTSVSAGNNIFVLSGGTLKADIIPAGSGGAFVTTSGRLSVDTIEQSLTIGSGGVLAPGNSIGSTTVADGSLSLLGGGIFEFEINDFSGTPGLTSSGWDTVSLDSGGGSGNGTLDLTGVNPGNPFVIDIDSLLADGSTPGALVVSPANGAYSFLLVDGGLVNGFTGSDQFLFDTADFNASGKIVNWSVSTDAGNLLLNALVVPEPSRATLLLLAAINVFARRRRHC